MNDGNIILCPAGEYGIVAERRGDNLVLIKSDKDGQPFLDYTKVNLVRETPENYESDDRLSRFYDYYTIAQTHSQAYRAQIQKADYQIAQLGAQPNKANLVPKRVTVKRGGKSFSAIRWVKVKAPSVKQRKQTETERKEMAPKQRLVQAWKEQLTPGVEEYKSIVSGDRDSLGKFVMKALWEKGVGQVETVKTVSLTDIVSETAKRITGVRPEGFEPEDIMQEVAIRFMEMQDSGKFANNQVPREKFASFLAQTVRNTSLEILRKQGLEKFAEKDINDFADSIADARQEPADEQMETVQAVEKVTNTIKNTYAKLPTNQKIVLNKVLNGKNHLTIAKELKITPDSVKGLTKRAYSNIVANLKRAGVKIPSDVKGVTKSIKEVLIREFGVPKNTKKFKAKILLRNGKLFLKAKRYEVGEVSPATGKTKVAPGKWEFVGKGKKGEGKDKEDKKKGKPAESKGNGKGNDKDNGKKKKGVDVSSLERQERKQKKDMIKDAIKGFVNTMTEVFSGRGGTEAATSEAQRAGAHAKGIKQTREAKYKSISEQRQQQ